MELTTLPRTWHPQQNYFVDKGVRGNIKAKYVYNDYPITLKVKLGDWQEITVNDYLEHTSLVKKVVNFNR